MVSQHDDFLIKLGLVERHTSTLSALEKEQIVRLWNAEYPASIQQKSIEAFENYLVTLADAQHLLVCDEAGQIQAWFVDFMRNEERFFAMIIYAKWQHKGVGSWLLNQAKSKHETLVGWVVDSDRFLKVDQSVYRSPLAFYMKNGFEPVPESRYETEVLSTVKIYWKRKNENNIA